MSKLPKPFEIRKTFTNERFVITKVNDIFCFYLYNNGISSMCQNSQMIEEVVTDKYDNFLDAVTSPEFKLSI